MWKFCRSRPSTIEDSFLSLQFNKTVCNNVSCNAKLYRDANTLEWWICVGWQKSAVNSLSERIKCLERVHLQTVGTGRSLASPLEKRNVPAYLKQRCIFVLNQKNTYYVCKKYFRKNRWHRLTPEKIIYFCGCQIYSITIWPSLNYTLLQMHSLRSYVWGRLPIEHTFIESSFSIEKIWHCSMPWCVKFIFKCETLYWDLLHCLKGRQQILLVPEIQRSQYNVVRTTVLQISGVLNDANKLELEFLQTRRSGEY